MKKATPPLTEARRYDSATIDHPLNETAETVLPKSTIGMQARKRALRELRCFPARIIREQARAAAQTKADELAAEAKADTDVKPKKAKKKSLKAKIKSALKTED